MTERRINNVAIVVITLALALAGTGLTLANTFPRDFDPQGIAIAVALSSSFLAAEVTFVFGHKVYERLKTSYRARMWRKAVLLGFLVALVLAMSLAVYSELKAATGRLSNEATAENVDSLLDKMNERATTKREKARNNANALKVVADDKLDFNLTPFVFCYLMAGVVSLVTIAVQPLGRKSTRPVSCGGGTGGDQIPQNPAIEETARKIGFVPVTASNVRAYLNSRGTGYNVYDGRQYLGHLPLTVISQQKLDQNLTPSRTV